MVLNSLILNIFLGTLIASFSTSNALAIKNNQEDSTRKGYLSKRRYKGSVDQVRSVVKAITNYNFNVILFGHYHLIVAKMEQLVIVNEDTGKRELTYIITAFPNYNGGYNPVKELKDNHTIHRRLLDCLMKIVLIAGHLHVNITLKVVVTENSKGQVEWIKGEISHPLKKQGKTYFHNSLKEQYFNIWSVLPSEEEGLFVNPIVYSIHALIRDEDMLQKSTIPFKYKTEVDKSNSCVSVFNNIKDKRRGKIRIGVTRGRNASGYVSCLEYRYFQETVSENIKVTIANDKRVPVFSIHPTHTKPLGCKDPTMAMFP